jgi:hypothetical protein
METGLVRPAWTALSPRRIPNDGSARPSVPVPIRSLGDPCVRLGRSS